MTRRTALSLLLIIAAAIWGALLTLQGVQVSPSWLRPLSAVTALMLGLIGFFDIFIWRIRLLQAWCVKRPNMRGTWEATLVSDWVNPETGQPLAPIRAYVVIRQTFSTLSLRLYTAESRSCLLGGEVARATDGTHSVTGVYQNDPKPEVRYRSEIHRGAIYLQVTGAPATRLEGDYWTDRRTGGSMTLTRKHKKIADGFDSAAALFDDSTEKPDEPSSEKPPLL